MYLYDCKILFDKISPEYEDILFPVIYIYIYTYRLFIVSVWSIHVSNKQMIRLWIHVMQYVAYI